MEEDKWNKAVVRKEQTNIADLLLGKADINTTQPVTPYNLGLVLLKKLMAGYRKEINEAENQALMLELKANYKDYLAITSMKQQSAD